MILNDEKGRRRQSTGSFLERPKAERRQAFTLVELVIAIVLLGLLVVLAFPALAGNKERSQRLLCVNNLRLAGQGIKEWETDHAGRVPWRTPFADGGTMGHPSGLGNNIWFQWDALSNYIQSPKILACPSDAKKRIATTWDFNPDTGFVHPNRQNNAVSYFVGLDVQPESRETLLAGDRNVRFNIFTTSCSSGVSPCVGISASPSSGAFGIEGQLHVGAGNFLFTDGRVDELSSQSFVNLVRATGFYDDNGQSHYLTTP